MKQKISCLISRIMRKQSAIQRSYLSSFASLITLLLIGCCTTSFASQNISNSNTSREKLWEQYDELWGQYSGKKCAFINDWVSKQNDLVQSLMALRKVYVDLGLNTVVVDLFIKNEMNWFEFLKDYQTFYFDKECKYEKFTYSHNLVEKRKW